MENESRRAKEKSKTRLERREESCIENSEVEIVDGEMTKKPEIVFEGEEAEVDSWEMKEFENFVNPEIEFPKWRVKILTDVEEVAVI